MGGGRMLTGAIEREREIEEEVGDTGASSGTV